MRQEATVIHLREKILSGHIVRTMFWLAWPVILANFVEISYNLVDAFWLGKLGKESFGAPTVSWPLIMLFYSIGFGFSSAGVALISQYFGAGNYRMASKSAGHLITFMGSMSLTISIVGYALAPYVLTLMGVPSDIYPLAVSYIRVIFVGIPITFMGFAFMVIANSLGDTRTPTVLSVTSSLTNMVLDPILIFGWFGLPALGVVGAAAATVASRSILSVVGTYLLFRGYKGVKVSLHDLGLEGWWLRKVVSVGSPLAIQRSSNALGFTIMMSIVSRFGSTAVAAYGVGIRVIDILQAFTFGVNRAASIMVGQNIGAEFYDRAKRIARTSVTVLTLILAVGAAAIYLTRDWVIAVFINDPSVIAEGANLLSIFSLSIPFFGIFFIGGGIAMGSGHTKFFAAVSIIRLWALRIGLSMLLAVTLNLGTTGIWVAMTISNIGAGLLALAWILKAGWTKRIIEEALEKPPTRAVPAVSPDSSGNSGKGGTREQ